MEKEKISKIMGIGIAIITLGSIFSFGIIYFFENNGSIETPIYNDLQPSEVDVLEFKTFFNTVVQDDLGAVRFLSITNTIDKQKIDSDIVGIKGVMRVNSELMVNREIDQNGWEYNSELILSSTANHKEILEKVLALEHFSGKEGTYEAKKNVRIKTPIEEVMVFNEDLNINREYNFDLNTWKSLSALADIDLNHNQEIMVTGVLLLQGKKLKGFELIQQNFDFEKTILDSNLPIDENSPLDNNFPGEGTDDNSNYPN